MEGNLCIGCKFSFVEIDISVPESYSIYDLLTQAKTYVSYLKIKEKTIAYFLTFEKNASALDFKVKCTCKSKPRTDLEDKEGEAKRNLLRKLSKAKKSKHNPKSNGGHTSG